MGKLALALAAVALVVLGVYLLAPGGRRAGALPLAPAGEARASAPAQVELAPVEGRREEVRPVAPAAAEEQPEPRANGVVRVEPAPKEIPLAGTIVVTDEQGREHPAEDGSFSLVLWSGDTGNWHEVEVHGGRWSTTLPAEPPLAGLGVEALRLGGRAAFCQLGEEERVPVPADGWLALTARWPSPSLLHVRARDSGAELAPVLLVEVSSWPESELGHPGAEVASARDLGPSPVQLPAPRDPGVELRTLYARSPGYAWGRIEMDERRGGERFLLLDQGGELEVNLSGRLTDPGARLRVYGKEHAPLVDLELAEQNPIVIGDLGAGSYRVAAEIGDYFSSPLSLGEAAVEIVAGARTRVTLALRELEPSTRVPLAGTLVLPAGWQLDDFQLDFRLQGTPLGGFEGSFAVEQAEMEAESASSETYRWKAPPVQPGRYRVDLHAVAYRAQLEVGPQGSTDARLVVPPPCDVLVRCTDEDTGLDVTDEQVSWFCVALGVEGGWTNENATWDGALQRWRFRAPVGEIGILVFGERYAQAQETLAVHAGTNEVLLRLTRMTSLKVVLRDGATEIPWSEDQNPELEPAEGQEPLHSWTRGSGSITLHEKQPGRYTLKVPEIPGFEPVAPIEVRLEKGVVTEYAVELVRKR